MKALALGLIVCFLSLSFAPIVVAQECVNTIPLDFGAKAPCAGLLFPASWATTSLRCLNVEVPRLEAEVQLLKGSLSACEQRIEGLTSLCDTKMGELISIVEETSHLNETQWYESPIFWGIVSFIAGGATVIGIYELADK
tara:strand:+ start:145 stop:564 length:420 start_codon:yes stop_codon:yes gene_type:complete